MRSKALILGGALVALGAAALKNRNKVAGLIGARSSVPEPPPPTAGPGDATFTSPQPSNYDLDGPPANTATHVPAPDPQVPEAIDEEAEIAAAAAEAANIGGEVSDYASSDPSLPADEFERPLFEAGEGDSEGQEQAEALLAENLEPPDAGHTPSEARIEEIIDQSDNPAVGERIEPRPATGVDESAEARRRGPTFSAISRFFDQREPGDAAGEPSASEEPGGSGGSGDEDSSDYQTWSDQAKKS